MVRMMAITVETTVGQIMVIGIMMVAMNGIMAGGISKVPPVAHGITTVPPVALLHTADYPLDRQLHHLMVPQRRLLRNHQSQGLPNIRLHHHVVMTMVMVGGLVMVIMATVDGLVMEMITTGGQVMAFGMVEIMTTTVMVGGLVTETVTKMEGQVMAI